MTIYAWTESYGDQYFQNYDMSKLDRDECFLTVNNFEYDNLILMEKYDDCIGCPYMARVEMFPKNVPRTVKINTQYSKSYKMNNGDYMMDLNGLEFAEFGVYEVNYNNGVYSSTTLKEPVSIYFPILTVALICAAAFLLIPLLTYVVKRFILKQNGERAKEGSGKVRIKSIDTFRGFCIVFMIFVNYGHGGYLWMEHAVWNGLYFGDLLFPWFVWIMGVCIPIAFSSMLKKNVPMWKIIYNITKRSCILFLLGLFLQGGNGLRELRIFGVLQRFSVSYFFVALPVLFQMYFSENRQWSKVMNIVMNVCQLPMQALFGCVILVHTLVIFLVKVEHCDAGYLGPGGNHMHGKYISCPGGVTGYVDSSVLGEHVYKYLPVTWIYNAPPFDPEGILGCLTTIYQVFLGVQAGTILVHYKTHNIRLCAWLAWGLVTGLIGAGLCGFSKEDGPIPLNKNLWSLSFVLVTSGLGFILLAVFYAIIDILKIWTGKPFLFAGMNSILLYVGHNMVYTNFPIHIYIADDDRNGTHFLTLLENIWATAFWVIASFFLYRKKFFLSV